VISKAILALLFFKMDFNNCDSMSKKYCESFVHGEGCKYIKECPRYPKLWRTDHNPLLFYSKMFGPKKSTKVEQIKALLGLCLIKFIHCFVK